MKNEKFINYANSFQAVARLRLESITLLLEFLGNPQRDLKYIHVAGTNGKGSVCAFLQCMFSNAGYKTGKYTSPNLVRVNERITVDGVEISDELLSELMEHVQEAAQQVAEQLGGMPTQFEIWTAVAFCYFKQVGCEMVILETGLGGTQDATNVIPAPEVAVITRIAMDHTDYLGNTIEEIAGAKAGIIKKHPDGVCGHVVTLKQDPAVLSVLEKACKDKQNILTVVDGPVIKAPQGMRECFNYGGFSDLVSGLGGAHQVENACLAIEVAKLLGLEEAHIRAGLIKAQNPARLELVSENPPVIFDGAHNKNGMQALVRSLKRYFPDEEYTLIYGCMQDKDISGVLEELGRIRDSIRRILTVPVRENPRAMDAEALAERVREAGFLACAYDKIQDAYLDALKDGGLTVFCGSLYLYKDFVECCK